MYMYSQLCALQVTIVSDLTQGALIVTTTADVPHLGATATTEEDLGQGHDLLIITGTLKKRILLSTCNVSPHIHVHVYASRNLKILRILRLRSNLEIKQAI